MSDHYKFEGVGVLGDYDDRKGQEHDPCLTPLRLKHDDASSGGGVEYLCLKTEDAVGLSFEVVQSQGRGVSAWERVPPGEAEVVPSTGLSEASGVCILDENSV